MVNHKERRGSAEVYRVRKDLSTTVRSPYDTRPLVAVETRPPFKEKVRRFFGMQPVRYVAYTPAVAIATTTTSPNRRTYYSNSPTTVRSHYSGGSPVSHHMSGSSYSSPRSTTYVRRTTTTRRR